MLFNEISLFLGELAQGAAVDEDKIQDIVDFETSLSTVSVYESVWELDTPCI